MRPGMCVFSPFLAIRDTGCRNPWHIMIQVSDTRLDGLGCDGKTRGVRVVLTEGTNGRWAGDCNSQETNTVHCGYMCVVGQL
jgi:hypothetical protein